MYLLSTNTMDVVQALVLAGKTDLAIRLIVELTGFMNLEARAVVMEIVSTQGSMQSGFVEGKGLCVGSVRLGWQSNHHGPDRMMCRAVVLRSHRSFLCS